MAKQTVNNIKLGVFVIAGIAFLILLLYMIGKNQNLFGNTFMLKARFDNAQGLMYGNNIRFAGIDAGTVKEIKVLNDTTIEVTLLVKTKLKPYIRKNATVSIATDGLMGNKIINITPAKEPAPYVEEGDILPSAKGPDTEEMLKVLDRTNNDLNSIASSLKNTVNRINDSKALWSILEDESIPNNIRNSFIEFSQAAENLNEMTANLDEIVSDVKQGKGSAGQILRDTTIAADLKDAIGTLKKIGQSADSLSISINKLVDSVSYNVNSGDGMIGSLLNDKEMNSNLEQTMKNIEQGTRAFNENMEALKQNWLFRGYFKKKSRQEEEK